MKLPARTRLLLCCAAALHLAGVPALDGEPNRDAQIAAKDHWVTQNLLSFDRPVVSFFYGGKPSAELLPGWRRAPVKKESLPDGRTRYVLTWTDPKTGLEARIVAVDYADYPAVEWTAYLRNTGATPTPILERVRGIDASFGSASMPATLRTTQGDNFSAGSYAPLEFKLDRQARSFEPAGGRPTNGAWPYFNVDYGRSGVIVALGWPGQWQALFSQENNAVVVRGGQETTRMRLLPGEEIRTPLVAVLFWAGEDWIAGQNLWRQWFLAHNIPRPGGLLPPLATSICPPSLHTSAAGDLSFLNSYLKQGLKIDYLWVDAGWYAMESTNWFLATGVGTWKPDPLRYPRGLREVSDAAHAAGMKFVLWFEPERVYRGSYLWEHHPEWLLKWDPKKTEDRDLRLLNLGDPDARRWLTDTISTFLTDQGVDLYRQDFNVDPLGAWEFNDGPDRKGMTENLYVQGYLTYWDALRERHPGLLIDSCASGGRRNDLETLRRAVPLLRSDYVGPNLSVAPQWVKTDVFDGNQGHTYGMAPWIPFYGTGENAEDVYSARSHLCPWVGVGTNLDDPDWAAFRRQLADHRAVADYFLGDYYPLTPYSKSEETWIAWEFVRPGSQDGMIQAFRRENAPPAEIRLRLRGLESGAVYEFRNMDSGRITQLSGAEAASDGLRIAAPAPRTALIITFRSERGGR